MFAHALCWHRDRLFFQVVAVLGIEHGGLGGKEK
jgi:hypothetical protein